MQETSSVFNMKYIYEASEDILGLIYISCKNIGNRKATGSYYTSTRVVKSLISKLDFQESQKILDPCCGTGNFLLQLPEHVTFLPCMATISIQSVSKSPDSIWL